MCVGRTYTWECEYALTSVYLTHTHLPCTHILILAGLQNSETARMLEGSGHPIDNR